jgi:hypothetical protein
MVPARGRRWSPAVESPAALNHELVCRVLEEIRTRHAIGDGSWRSSSRRRFRTTLAAHFIVRISPNSRSVGARR